MLQIKESVFAKSRPSNRGNGTYDSGWMTLDSLKQMVTAAENAGLNAIGFTPKTLKDAGAKKWSGTVIEITPFKLAPKKD